MLLPILSLASAALAGGLTYSLFQGRKLRKELAQQARDMEWNKQLWDNLNAQARRETGFETATEAVRGYQQLCRAFGSSLHNYGHEGPLSAQQRSYLGAAGYLLQAISGAARWRELDAPGEPQVKGWANDSVFGSGKAALREAPEELRPLLDGLTLHQLLHLTTQLLVPAESVNLTMLFERMGIYLLTADGKSQKAADKATQAAVFTS